MKYDVIVIGAGLSGLTAGSLLAKRGLKVALIDKNYNPGGSCGIFKRDDIIFDQGTGMLFGFGDNGFNPHRFLFNCLEEPIDMIKHDFLYCVNYRGNRIKFWPDITKFAEELGEIFPNEEENIKKFYNDLLKIYQEVIVENPVFSTPDEVVFLNSFISLIKHPLSQLRFLSFLNKSTESLLRKYFSEPDIFWFFDKLTSTYCYTTVKETPAILGAIMFVDNHLGGSYYPAGSTVFLPGKLEKVIEENGGEMLMKREVTKIIFGAKGPIAVKLDNGEIVYADDFIYSGTVWNLYGKLIDENVVSPEKVKWAERQIPTYPSIVLYAVVDKNYIPSDTLPVEMLVGNPEEIDESEVTVYIFSIDDRTVCEADSHVVMAIGPSFKNWKMENKEEYKKQKEEEKMRLLDLLERRFPGFKKGLKYSEVATPKTIERFTMKNSGAVAGPKQMLGQHMLKRLHTKSSWSSLFFCGESTVMGTGTPAVTVSGIAAANAVLKKRRQKGFNYQKGMKNFVNIVNKPYEKKDLFSNYTGEKKRIMQKAWECLLCERPNCSKPMDLDLRGIMRRVVVGNFYGAKKLARIGLGGENKKEFLKKAQGKCVKNIKGQEPVEIEEVIDYLLQ